MWTVAGHLPQLLRWARGRLPARARDLADTLDLVQDTRFNASQQVERFDVRAEGALYACLRQTLVKGASYNRYADAGGGKVPTPAWQIHGRYYETCSCDFVCPCILGQMAVRPTKGSCTFAMAFQVDRGSYGAVSLDGLGFIVVGLTPEVMGKGNWSVGVIADDRANAEQRDALGAIASGQAGGPMSALSGLVSTFLGVATAPIRFERDGFKWSVTASNLVDMAAEGVKGVNPNATEPMHIDNTGHPASDRLALARATRSHVHALGLAWDDATGRNNGHFAPFTWRSA